MTRPELRIGRSLLGALVVVSIGLAPIEVAANPCNWGGQATATLTGYDGGVVSYHKGQITNVDCAHSQNMILRMNVLESNDEVWADDQIGDKALFSAAMEHSLGFIGCDGSWTNGTRFGTRFLGINSWLDSAVDGPTQAECGSTGGGGVGGAGDCNTSSTETTTTALTSMGSEAGPGEEPRIGLTRVSERSDGRFIQEEWVLLSWDTGELRPEFASSDRYLDHVEDHLDHYRSFVRGGSNVLLVEAAEHLPNHRDMPPPGLAPLDVEVDWPSRTGRQEFWFRVEIAEDGEVDRVLLLDSTDAAGSSEVRSALRERLRLQYPDDRRHRTVVYGRAIVTPSARLIVQDSLAIVPRCCCYSDEVGIWCP